MDLEFIFFLCVCVCVYVCVCVSFMATIGSPTGLEGAKVGGGVYSWLQFAN